MGMTTHRNSISFNGRPQADSLSHSAGKGHPHSGQRALPETPTSEYPHLPHLRSGRIRFCQSNGITCENRREVALPQTEHTSTLIGIYRYSAWTTSTPTARPTTFATPKETCDATCSRTIHTNGILNRQMSKHNTTNTQCTRHFDLKILYIPSATLPGELHFAQQE